MTKRTGSQMLNMRRLTLVLGFILALLGSISKYSGAHQFRKSGPLPAKHSCTVFPIRSDDSQSNSHPSGFVTYSFEGFNQSFVLQLEPVMDLLPKFFHVMTLSEGLTNSSLHVDSGHHLQYCLYKGKLKNESKSSVSINVCNGLFGVINSCRGAFHIEPIDMNNLTRGHVLVSTNAKTPLRDGECLAETGASTTDNVILLRPKRSVSQEWNVELLVVADSKMKRYHGDNLEMYVLTLLASAALIFKEPSIGNNINLTVVKLVVMSENQDTDIISSSASKILRHFCRWQRQLNDTDSANGLHHDIAILLTREDLCRHSQTCDTLGLAQSGMVCDPESSCAVIEDNGLSAAFTIAHEIGHVLGIPHDDEEKCDRFKARGRDLFVMARMLDYNTHPWSWSECSSHYITSFLDAGHGYCLLNKSQKNILNDFEHLSTPSGELYDMDYQCKLVFGKESKICPFMPVCKRLWCTMGNANQSGCRTHHTPWADGTRCGFDKSCLHGECVQDPVYFMPPQDGQWGKWQNFGSCSRSCGGGIKRSIRECDSPRPTNGGSYCVGHRVRYRSCNTQECPHGSKDFREEQCQAFNGKTFGFTGIHDNVKWVPHYSGIKTSDYCKLYCRAADTAAYFLLKEKVIDGTKCGPETFDVCMNGKCASAGCDHRLNSKVTTDVCGVCGGNGTTCKVVHGQFAEVQYGYNNVVKVPAGASNIEIIQHGHENTRDDNYLALKSEDDTYILNGDFMITMFPKTLYYAGSRLEYSGSDSVIERINGTKKLQRDLYVQVLTVGSLHPPSVTFNYTVSLAEDVLFYWHLEENWSPCNSICQGEQYRKTVCVNKENGQIMNDSQCYMMARPSHQAKVCNTGCVLRWQINQGTHCSVVCGRGFTTRNVTCAKHLESGEVIIILDHFCAHMEPRPSETVECFGNCSSTEWIYGDWTKCSASCGGGIQFRKAACFGNGQVELPDEACSSTKITEQACSIEDCPHWVVGEWRECTATCGYGERHRPLWCKYDSQIVYNELCNGSVTPSNVEQCVLPRCATWDTTMWEPCSATCGVAVSHRRVLCRSESGNPVSNRHCDESSRPSDKKPCEVPPCETGPSPRPRLPESAHENFVPHHPDNAVEESGHLTTSVWKTGQWSSCSASCGEGLMYRQVLCHNPGTERILPDKKCSKYRRPHHIRPCHLPTCGLWSTGKWSECSVTCGGGYQTRRVLCLVSDGRRSEDHFCNAQTKPERERICHAKDCPNSSRNTSSTYIQEDIQSSYYWRTGSWGRCSKTCGGGLKRRQVACYNELRQLTRKCDVAKKPVDVSSCNIERCPEWKTSDWSSCSVTCGRGKQMRQVLCVNHIDEEIPQDRCTDAAPEKERKCRMAACLYWAWSPWSQCSTSCGQGTQQRVPVCRRGSKVDSDDLCDPASKPQPQTKTCRKVSCTYHWKKQNWSKCSTTCGDGFKYREVGCVSASNTTVEEQFCSHQRKPRAKRKCHQYSCSMTWKASHWSECSLSCGKGIQTRRVTCHRVNSYQWVNPQPVPRPKNTNEIWCDANLKPVETRGCSVGACGKNMWRAGTWSPCSVGCGAGRQKRRVHCYSPNGNKFPNSQCEENLRPQRRRKCSMRPCPGISCLDFQKRGNITEDGEQEIFVRGRYVKIYCSGMNTSSPKEYITLVRGEGDNFSEIYNKRLVNPDTCPYRGSRYDSCDCITDESAGFGLTTFHRIAINISTLQVYNNDLKFSQTHIGIPVAFGESGDCYSMNSCPQGRFSLSLLGTGFVVSPLTKWVTHGNYPSSRIRWLEGGQVIQGKCGGYCGKCAPDNNIGLLLEVAPP